MKNKTTELYILNRSDLDRMDAAVGLLRQVIEELVQARMVEVPLTPDTPGALYELSDELELLDNQRRKREGGF